MKFNEKSTSLGIEFGSTTIKLVLVDEQAKVLAIGKHVWENSLENGIWTYSMDDIHGGLKSAYKDLKSNVKKDYDVDLTEVGSIGISAMMHGYIALDENDNLLVPFRTWRNTTTAQAADELSDLFDFNIPLRWSIAHLHQAILSGEEHITKIKKVMTLACYIHYKLTGKFVLGVGDASGMFPIDSTTGDYNAVMLAKFNAILEQKGLDYKLEDVFPKVLTAGDNAGELVHPEIIDEDLVFGIPMCPAEGDAGTGMVATNSVEKSTGNVSAGTSIFAMIVLEKALSKMYKEIDIVTTPDGSDVAMVHCNNCTSDLNAWAEMFSQFAKKIGVDIKPYKVLDIMFESADKNIDFTSILTYNYVSGEPITGLSDGRPMLIRKSDSDFSFDNLAKSSIYSALATLKIGLDILFVNENVKINKLLGHGGFFKASFGQDAMAAAANAPVSIMETAGEGGAYGMAILASFMLNKNNLSLSEYLNEYVFKDSKILTVEPKEDEKAIFAKYLENYTNAIPVVQKATELF